MNGLSSKTISSHLEVSYARSKNETPGKITGVNLVTYNVNDRYNLQLGKFHPPFNIQP